MAVITAEISSSTGGIINPEFQLLSIDVCREYNKIPYAELVYIDGNAAKKKFELSDLNYFDIGNLIEVKIIYGPADAEKKASVFKGRVMKQGFQMRPEGITLSVDLSDEAVVMTAARKSAVFEDQTDSKIIESIISKAKVGTAPSVGKIETTSVEHKKMVQYASTDWDFIMCRAEANGMLLSSLDGEISMSAPKLSPGPKLTLEFGKDEILDFDFEANGRNQIKELKAQDWNSQTNELSAEVSAESVSLSQAKLNAADLYKTMGSTSETIVSGIKLSKGEAKSWADSKMFKSRVSMLRGRVKIKGNPSLKIGDVLELKGVSNLFTGKTIITGIRHQIDTEGWVTNLQFGIDPSFYDQGMQVSILPAYGLLPAVNGLQIGIVEKFDPGKKDPYEENRILVKIPSIKFEKNTVWAKLCTLDAGPKRGFNFYPDAGDEVILGFLNDDPRQAVILGSVHSATNKPPIEQADENPQKGLTTKSGISILFDDKEQFIRIATSKDNLITIDEKKKSIEIKDANKNTIKMDDKGISIESGKDFILKSAGNFEIDASSGNVKIKGKAIDVI